MEISSSRTPNIQQRAPITLKRANFVPGRTNGDAGVKKADVSNRKPPSTVRSHRFLKVVVRLLPPGLKEDDFFEQVSEYVNENSVADKYYVAGAFSLIPFQPPTHSRAYILFKDGKTLDRFLTYVRKCSFKNSGGVNSEELFTPIAEIAFYSEMSNSKKNKTPNPRSESLENDPIFKLFKEWYTQTDPEERERSKPESFLLTKPKAKSRHEKKQDKDFKSKTRKGGSKVKEDVVRKENTSENKDLKKKKKRSKKSESLKGSNGSDSKENSVKNSHKEKHSKNLVKDSSKDVTKDNQKQSSTKNSPKDNLKNRPKDKNRDNSKDNAKDNAKDNTKGNTEDNTKDNTKNNSKNRSKEKQKDNSQGAKNPESKEPQEASKRRNRRNKNHVKNKTSSDELSGKLKSSDSAKLKALKKES